MSAFTGSTARRRPSTPTLLIGAPVLAALLGALLALVVGSGAGGGAADRPARPTGRALAVGDLRVTLPEGWRPASKGARVPGFPHDGHTLHARVGDPALGGGDVAIAVLPAQRPSLLPRALDDGGMPPRGVEAGAVRGSYYFVSSTVSRDVIVVPTTQGVVTIACTDAPPGDCEQALAGLRLARGAFLAPDASAAFLSRLPGATSTLDAQRARERGRLAHARDAQRGARAATRLAAAYDTAARALRPLAPGRRGPAAATIDLLETLHARYGRLGAAVRAGDRSAFRTAATAIDADEARLAASLKAWRPRLAGPAAS
jgi:hypothetical protein